MHCLAAQYSELAPSTCTFANQLHCAVALLRLPNVLLSGLGGALLEAAHCTALAREQSVGVVWMQPLQCPQETPSGSSVTAGRGTAAALQCSTMQCCPLTRLLQHRTCTMHMLLLLRHRHQLQHEADTACQTAGRLRMGLLLFEIDQ